MWQDFVSSADCWFRFYPDVVFSSAYSFEKMIRCLWRWFPEMQIRLFSIRGCKKGKKKIKIQGRHSDLENSREKPSRDLTSCQTITVPTTLLKDALNLELPGWKPVPLITGRSPGWWVKPMLHVQKQKTRWYLPVEHEVKNLWVKKKKEEALERPCWVINRLLDEKQGLYKKTIDYVPSPNYC